MQQQNCPCTHKHVQTQHGSFNLISGLILELPFKILWIRNKFVLLFLCSLLILSTYITLRELMQYLCNKLFSRRKSKTHSLFFHLSFYNFHPFPGKTLCTMFRFSKISSGNFQLYINEISSKRIDVRCKMDRLNLLEHK